MRLFHIVLGGYERRPTGMAARRPSGGWLAFSSYGKGAFEPMSGLYEARMRSYGVPLPVTTPFSWQRLNDPEAAGQLLRDAGLRNIRVYSEQLGYDLHTANEWWDIVWNSGFRGPISQLPESQLERFMSEHLAEVAAKFDTQASDSTYLPSSPWDKRPTPLLIHLPGSPHQKALRLAEIARRRATQVAIRAKDHIDGGGGDDRVQLPTRVTYGIIDSPPSTKITEPLMNLIPVG